MNKQNYAYDSNVFIDKCRQCKGIWTDKGELIAIAEHIKEDPKVTETGKCIIESEKKTKRTATILDWLGELADFLLWW